MESLTPPTMRPLARAVLTDADVREVGPSIASVLASGEKGAPYDRRARTYDRLVGSRPYNRLMWGTRPDDYRNFALEGIASGEGPLLEVPCGTAVFTASGYRRSSRDCLLVDRSVAMLERAAQRLGDPGNHPPENVALLQGDLYELPLRAGHFESIVFSGALHLFADVPSVIGALTPLAMPGGRFFASGLIAATAIGSRYLSALSRAGEVAAPRSEAELRQAVESTAPAELAWRRIGCMVFASWTVRAT